MKAEEARNIASQFNSSDRLRYVLDKIKEAAEQGKYKITLHEWDYKDNKYELDELIDFLHYNGYTCDYNRHTYVLDVFWVNPT